MVSMANVAAQIMEHMCTCPEHGYSQPGRTGTSGYCSVQTDAGVKKVKKGDRDCSSAVSDAWGTALEGTPWEGKIPITSTHYMKDIFLASGLFEWKPMSFIAQRGDPYLKIGHHTAMCISAVPDMLAEFSISETGGIDGRPGDQTGRESSIHAYYDYGNGWDGILHYNGKADTVTPVDKSRVVQLYTPNGTDAQKWKPIHNSDGTISLQNKASGLFLDVKAAGKAKGVVVQAYPKNGTDAQKFFLRRVPKAVTPYGGKTEMPFNPPEIRPFMLVPKCAANLRVDCKEGGVKPGTRIQLWTQNYSRAQWWYILDGCDGYWTLMNDGTTPLALDVLAGGKVY